MRRARRRLQHLEQAGHGAEGLRVFTQDLDNASIYRETAGGEEWTEAQISELSAQGWTVIKIVYESRRVNNDD